MTFDSNVEDGGLRNGYEVSVLICYLLKNAKEPLTKNELNEILTEKGLVNYFELTNSLSELIKLEQIEYVPNLMGEIGFSITRRGIVNLDVLENEIPRSVRERAVEAKLLLLARKSRLNNYSADIVQTNDGYQVSMKILDVGSDLMDMNLFVPDIAGAKKIRSAFLNDPQLLYKGVIAILTGDLDTVGELVPTKDEKLF
jgi:hypothetical protein